MVEVTFAGLEQDWEIRVEYDPPDDPISRGSRSCKIIGGLQHIRFVVQPFRKLTWELDWYDGGTYVVVGIGEFAVEGVDACMEWNGTTFVQKFAQLSVPSGKRALDVGGGVV